MVVVVVRRSTTTNSHSRGGGLVWYDACQGSTNPSHPLTMGSPPFHGAKVAILPSCCPLPLSLTW